MLLKIRDKVIEIFNKLSKMAKIGLAVGGVLFVIILTLLILYFTRVEYQPVASGLTLEEASVVTNKLDQMGVPWIEGPSGQILVPKSQVYKSRMELAVSMSSGLVTWNDIFTNDSITMTAQSREQMFIQAKAAEIKASIETIVGIKNAKVILQIPKESNYFINEDVESKASIMLELSGISSLNESQVSGIVNLVVNSVKGLSPENVTILDSTGVQLNSKNYSDFSGGSQFDLQSKMEEKLRQDTTNFLEKIYGRGNVEVKPSIKLNFDKQTLTSKVFSPPVEGESSGMVRSASTISENVNNAAIAAGAPGTDTNTNEATNIVSTGDSTSAYIKASQMYNYELNEILSEIVKAEGTVYEMHIAVLLNTKSLVNNTLTDEHKAELINLIAVSAGMSSANVSVVASEFPDPLLDYDIYTDASASGTGVSMSMLLLVIGALVVVFVVIAVLILNKNKKKRQSELEEIQRIKEVAEGAADDDTLDEIGISIKEDKGSPKYHVEKFVDKNPEAAVQLLRAWFNEN